MKNKNHEKVTSEAIEDPQVPVLKGIPAAPGIAIGKAFMLDSEEFTIPARPITGDDIPIEITRFENALIKTRAEILAVQQKISQGMGAEHGEIFNAHLLVLEDRMLIEEVIIRIEKENMCVEHIFQQVLKKYVNVFSNMDDEYLKERTVDIEDVGKRILRNLLGKERQTIRDINERVIIVAYDLSPSDTAGMHKDHVIGFVTDIGGRTSHTAILAKALEIPAVVGLEHATDTVRPGDMLIVDGREGKIYINPTEEILAEYKTEQKHFAEDAKDLLKIKELPSQTLDGHVVELSGNIEFPEEIPSVKEHGADGIGLYRTEYFCMNRTDMPSEEEHYEAYRKVAMEMAPASVVIRTLDLGGDKFLSQLDVPKEMNPFLGWRAIRFCLARPDVFKAQIRAILRASVHGNIKMMYPMISGLEELRQANAILEECKKELRAKKIPFKDTIEVGAMIEVPSAALTCDLLAKEADFFSIGTNDLIQYALAVDRVNEKIAYLYEPAHPGVLRLIKMIIDTGHEAGIWVGMCGEMAGDPAFSLILLGLGLDEFSTSAVNILPVKKLIRSVSFEQAQKVAEHALRLSTGKEVEAYAEAQLKDMLADKIE